VTLSGSPLVRHGLTSRKGFMRNAQGFATGVQHAIGQRNSAPHAGADSLKGASLPNQASTVHSRQQVNCRITSIAHPRSAGAISSVRSVHHWATPPLTARRVGLVGLKQLSETRLAHPLMLRQALNLVQHPCWHPVISALESDTSAAVHAELQDWKSLSQTRTLWLPALQTDGVGLVD
jgi:hypothetical protein